MTENTKSTKSTKAKGTDVSVKPDAVIPAALAKAIADKRTAMVAGVEAITALESRAIDDLTVAYRSLGDTVRALAADLITAAEGTKGVAPTDWPAVRKAIWPGTKTGDVTVAGRSEAVVQRAVKVSLYVPDARAIDAWRQARTAIMAKASAPKATDAVRQGAKHTAFADGGLKGLTAFAEAKANKRINRDGTIVSGSNRAQSDAVKTINARAEDATEAVATVSDADASAEERQDAMASVIVPGITVGMLTSLSEADLRVLSTVALDMAKAKAKTPKAKTSPVAPVLESTAPVVDATPSPLAGINPETLAAAVRLLQDAGMASV
jgi:hypothetical protein